MLREHILIELRCYTTCQAHVHNTNAHALQRVQPEVVNDIVVRLLHNVPLKPQHLAFFAQSGTEIRINGREFAGRSEHLSQCLLGACAFRCAFCRESAMQ